MSTRTEYATADAEVADLRVRLAAAEKARDDARAKLTGSVILPEDAAMLRFPIFPGATNEQLRDARPSPEVVKEVREALERAYAMQRELEQALCSPFPGEEMAIAQFQSGKSVIERSMFLRLKTIAAALAKLPKEGE
ncbi:MAG: hypothetical protein WAV09_03100 [Minisyncoccia bacterium]